MKTMFTAALMLSAACVATLASAQAPGGTKPAPMEQLDPAHVQLVPVAETVAVATSNPALFGDAQSLANPRDVAQARRAYRAACQRGASVAFCECITAGMAQTLMPEEVRIAARGVRDRLSAQGDAASSEPVDSMPNGQSSAERIVEVESQYANACSQFRGPM